MGEPYNTLRCKAHLMKDVRRVRDGVVWCRASSQDIRDSQLWAMIKGRWQLWSDADGPTDLVIRG